MYQILFAERNSGFPEVHHGVVMCHVSVGIPSPSWHSSQLLLLPWLQPGKKTLGDFSQKLNSDHFQRVQKNVHISAYQIHASKKHSYSSWPLNGMPNSRQWETSQSLVALNSQVLLSMSTKSSWRFMDCIFRVVENVVFDNIDFGS